MSFKKLDINGFKSFSEKTTILIEDGLTGIVGPNGCGKSNIVEALRWYRRKLRQEYARLRHGGCYIFRNVKQTFKIFQ